MDEIHGYKYIYFQKWKKVPPRKTEVWSVKNNHSGEELGKVKWHPAWRQYCYFPTVQAVYSVGCLEDIAEFIEEEMAKYKQAKLDKLGFPAEKYPEQG